MGLKQKKKARKQRKKKANSSDDDELQFLDEIIAENEQQEVIELSAGFVQRCTYCQPTIGFDTFELLKAHMTSKHLTQHLFVEQSPEVQQRTVDFHATFYSTTGHFKDEVAYKVCKCTNLPKKTTRSKLYIHSL